MHEAGEGFRDDEPRVVGKVVQSGLSGNCARSVSTPSVWKSEAGGPSRA
jgi:hypothetical protein